MALVLLVGASGHAQDSQFLFDPNGNLFVQTGATTALPQILGQPQNRIVAPDEAATFTVVAADTRLLNYQWRFNGTNLFGATNDAVLLQNVSTNHEGEYRVVLTNPSGSVTSAPALLVFDSDADGMGDSWEFTYFGALTNSATADSDGDGVSNVQEFFDNTSPTNSASSRYRIVLSSDGGTILKTPDQSSYTNGETVTLTAVSSSLAPFRAWLGDVVTPSNSITLVMTNNKTLSARFTPIVLRWTGLSGDWNVASNWSPNLVPVTNDTVILTGAVIVTLNTNADCMDVTLAGPTLTGSGILTVRGSMLWSAGTMSGSGRTTIGAGATLSIANPSQVLLNTRTLENGGAALWTGAGNLVLVGGGVLTNRAGALFHVQGSGSFAFNGNENGRIDNAGTFRKSDNAGMTSTGGVGFNNSGTVDVQTGTLALGGGGTQTGSFNVPAGTTLNLSGGTHTVNGSSSITGTGQFSVSGGTANLAGLVNVTGSNIFSGGTANLTGNTICTNNTITISGGAANFSGTGLVSPAFVTLSSGSLGGTGTVSVNNTMSWTGGNMIGSGRTIIGAGATLSIANPSQVLLNTRTLDNSGTTIWAGAGNIIPINSGVITNRSGALFHVQGSGGFSFNGNENGRIDNAGTFRKSTHAGTTAMGGVSFNNYGSVDIRSGILAANGGYVSTSNALLNCTLGGTTPGTNHGQLQVGGAITLNGALSVDFTNGFSPALNDSFAVLTAGTRNGAFASFFYPSNAVTMQLSNSPNSVIARVTALSIPRPMLLPPELIGSNVKLSWTSVSNASYRLEFNPDVANLTNWNPIAGDVTATSNIVSKVDALTASNRLYRVRVLP